MEENQCSDETLSPALSDYSSCDESEMERYSSANSILGGSSVCSSVGNRGESLDFFGGSFVGDEMESCSGKDKLLRSCSRNGDATNLGGVDHYYDGMNESDRENGHHGDRVFWGKSSVLPRIRNWSRSFMGLNGKWKNGEKVDCDKKNLPLSTICYSETSSRYSSQRQVPPREDNIHDLCGTAGSSFQDSCSMPSFKITSVPIKCSKTFERQILDGENSTLEFGRDDEDSRLDGDESSYHSYGGLKKINCSVIENADKKRLESMGYMDGDLLRIPISESQLPSLPFLESVPPGSTSTKAFRADEAESLNARDLTKMDEANTLNTDDFFDEIFLDMKDIFLDSGESHRARYGEGNRSRFLVNSLNFKGGHSTTSTSQARYLYPLIQHPTKIDWVEVVGAKQKKGDVSFGERLVGVKEYTVYILRVQSGKDQWEVERRYRDFFSLYCQLKTLFTGNGLPLPSPWSKVEHETMKIFGNTSSTVINERITLIQDCLSSILSCRAPFGNPSSLVWFLSPSKDLCKSKLLNILIPESVQRLRNDVKSNPSYNELCTENGSTVGKTLLLVTDVVPPKSMSQLLEEQHYTCAGCHRSVDTGKTLMQGIARTLGWGGPRICKYTGQLFCALCHAGDTAVLPAKVLHHWDFSLYPVSQLAQIYLESIYDQPLLCASAINPILFSKVPTLHHVMAMRKKIKAMLPYVRCAFRNSMGRGLGSRSYLLESHDFFALRDLVDLSKGAFAAIPAIIESVSSKIHDHVMHQCVACYDVGVPCAARQNCRATSFLIFPFQEAEIIRCTSCGFVSHEICIEHLGGCTCGELVTIDCEAKFEEAQDHEGGIELDGFADSPVDKPNAKSSMRFISEFLSMERLYRLWQT